jgi:hypothetical protein
MGSVDERNWELIFSWWIYIAHEHFILGFYSDIYHITGKNIRFIGIDEYNANG